MFMISKFVLEEVCFEQIVENGFHSFCIKKILCFRAQFQDVQAQKLTPCMPRTEWVDFLL